MTKPKVFVRKLGFVVSLSFVLCGCSDSKSSRDNPASAEFAARCSAALQIYYVEGGKGPEFAAKSARARYWSKRYHELSGGEAQFSPALKAWQAIHRELSEAHKGRGIAKKNEAMKQIMDRCAPYET